MSHPDPSSLAVQSAMAKAGDALLLEFQGAVAGRYALERELGRGGMGIVYVARDLRLDRVVAIKLLPPGRAKDTIARERFLREARTAAKLSHPHIIPIHAVEEAGDFVYFVMAYVDGETLGARVRRDGPMRPFEAARTLHEIAWALAYAHSQGVIHRDVKPDNVLLERGTGRALVADFGIARLVQAAGASGEGELVGTPEFMSPEQALSGTVDGRSDLYALGVVAYYLLSGRLPFTGATVPALLTQHATKQAPALNVPGAPRALLAAVERCLEKDPAARFQSGEELSSALSAALAVRRDLPVPVRAFLAGSRTGVRAQVAATWVVSALLIPTGLAMLVRGVFPSSIPAVFSIGINVVALILGGAAIVAPVVWEVRRIRRLLRAGYRREDLVQGLALERERRREEQEYADGTAGAGPTKWERLMARKAYGSLALAALAGAAAFFLPYPAVLVAFGLFGLASATAVATGIAAHAAARGRLGAEEETRLKFWKGRFGRLLFRLSRIALGRPAAPPTVADRPTEVALGLAALDLFEALPEEVRRQLAELPGVVRSLEERVRALRGNGQDARPSEALGALETIRLDLLRLHGGVGTLQGLTADLSAARRIGDEVDALLAGRREVEEALD